MCVSHIICDRDSYYDARGESPDLNKDSHSRWDDLELVCGLAADQGGEVGKRESDADLLDILSAHAGQRHHGGANGRDQRASQLRHSEASGEDRGRLDALRVFAVRALMALSEEHRLRSACGAGGFATASVDAVYPAIPPWAEKWLHSTRERKMLWKKVASK